MLDKGGGRIFIVRRNNGYSMDASGKVKQFFVRRTKNLPVGMGTDKQCTCKNGVTRSLRHVATAVSLARRARFVSDFLTHALIARLGGQAESSGSLSPLKADGIAAALVFWITGCLPHPSSRVLPVARYSTSALHSTSRLLSHRGRASMHGGRSADEKGSHPAGHGLGTFAAVSD